MISTLLISMWNWNPMATVIINAIVYFFMGCLTIGLLARWDEKISPKNNADLGWSILLWPTLLVIWIIACLVIFLNQKIFKPFLSSPLGIIGLHFSNFFTWIRLGFGKYSDPPPVAQDKE